ncbi:hypothetical protein ACLOJK_011991 [Asimina triloba]
MRQAPSAQRKPQRRKGRISHTPPLMAVISRVQRAALSAARRLGLAAQSRSYGAAALQEYYYYDDEEEEVEDRLELRAETLGSMAGRGVQWALIGYPGVQKHIYAARLSKLLEVPHISMGSLVRQELNPRSSLYKQGAAKRAMIFAEDLEVWRRFGFGAEIEWDVLGGGCVWIVEYLLRRGRRRERVALDFGVGLVGDSFVILADGPHLDACA